MNKEIKYNGYTAQPSDYECPDGDLTMSLGMVPEDGSLHPIMPPKVLATWANLHRVYIHKNNFIHYIVIQGGEDSTLTFSWCDEKFGALSAAFLTLTSESLNSIVGIGNMLIVSSSSKMYYLLWKKDAYILLGNQVPDVDIAFGLAGEVVSHVYTGKGITRSSNATTATGEGWTTIAQLHYGTIADGQGEVHYTYFNESVKLSKGVQYACSVSYGEYVKYPINLEGKNSSGQYETITGFDTINTAHHHTFISKGDYTSLRIKVWDESRSNTLILEQGAQSSVTYAATVDNTEDNYNGVMAILNSFNNKYGVERGRFIYPFFVRYAVRMFDGSYMHISPPILMVPNSGYAPFLYYVTQRKDAGDIDITAYAFAAELRMRAMSVIPENWRDIISGVDIFVSQPIYPYKQGQAYDNSNNDLFVYKAIDYDAAVNEVKDLDYGNLLLSYSGNEVDGKYSCRNLYDCLHEYYSFGNQDTEKQWLVLQLAPKGDEAITDEVTSMSSFYLVKSLTLDEMPTNTGEFVSVDIKEGTLSSLVNRKALSDELLSTRTLKSANLYSYNNRLHAFNASFSLPKPKELELTNNYLTPGNAPNNPYLYRFNHIYVYISSVHGDKVVHLETSDSYAHLGVKGLAWFYYPDNNAYKAVFVSNDFKSSRAISLKRHDMLNGAYWYAGALDGLFPIMQNNEFQQPSENAATLTPSSVYVSEVNNPFTFRAAMTVSVGCNSVLAIASSAKPLSTGQFGQFPLYAFTDNGVWALETSSTGSYIARQPITRDICISADSICQLESSVLFASDRGIMELSGSSADCITDNIKTEFPFAFYDKLGSFNILADFVNKDMTPDEKLVTKDNITVLPFKQFLLGCRIVNDYVDQRIIFFNPAVRYAYVFSRQTAKWGMMQSDCVMPVNSYPDALAIDEDGNLLDFGQTTASRVSVILVSRPFAMGEPDIHKTINAVIQRGYFRKGAFGQVLYGSNDLFHWYPVGQSADSYLRNISGSGYKFFRTVIIGHMSKDECLYGCSLDFRQKLDNQIR